jgi:gamma-glutamyltranspeptidase/glutathione hydrolase
VAGERLANPDLAEYLCAIAREGDGDFYEGETARRIALAMREGDGLVTLEDLASYRVEERRPFESVYRGWRLWTNPPPSFGGSLLALSLRLLEAAGPRLLRFGGGEHVARLVATMREVDRQRAAGFCDNPELDDDALREGVGRIRTATGGTTHVSIVDREGNAASMTTSNGEGSGFIAPGTGIMLNNMMGEDDLHPEGFHSSPAGLRVASMMSPSVLVGDRGQMLVLGSGGSKRIRTALLQVLVNRIDIGMPLEEAVDAPRLHWDGERLQVEPGFGPEAMTGTAGVLSNVWSVRDIYFGGVHAVSMGSEAAADARRGGAARVID